MNKEPCRVGGWVVETVPGTLFTFGDGNATNGPYELSEIAAIEEMVGYHAFEGIAIAEPISNERPCQCGSGETWVNCSAAESTCG